MREAEVNESTEKETADADQATDRAGVQPGAEGSGVEDVVSVPSVDGVNE